MNNTAGVIMSSEPRCQDHLQQIDYKCDMRDCKEFLQAIFVYKEMENFPEDNHLKLTKTNTVDGNIDIDVSVPQFMIFSQEDSRHKEDFASEPIDGGDLRRKVKELVSDMMNFVEESQDLSDLLIGDMDGIAIKKKFESFPLHSGKADIYVRLVRRLTKLKQRLSEVQKTAEFVFLFEAKKIGSSTEGKTYAPYPPPKKEDKKGKQGRSPHPHRIGGIPELDQSLSRERRKEAVTLSPSSQSLRGEAEAECSYCFQYYLPRAGTLNEEASFYVFVRSHQAQQYMEEISRDGYDVHQCVLHWTSDLLRLEVNKGHCEDCLYATDKISKATVLEKHRNGDRPAHITVTPFAGNGATFSEAIIAVTVKGVVLEDSRVVIRWKYTNRQYVHLESTPLYSRHSIEPFQRYPSPAQVRQQTRAGAEGASISSNSGRRLVSTATTTTESLTKASYSENSSRGMHTGSGNTSLDTFTRTYLSQQEKQATQARRSSVTPSVSKQSVALETDTVLR